MDAPHPLPLANVRILAIEQMQAIPYATQLLAHLGACPGGTILPTVEDSTPCSLLSAERVGRIASVATEVMLRTGAAFEDQPNVALSLNGDDFDGMGEFIFYRRPLIASIYPTGGPVLPG